MAMLDRYKKKNGFLQLLTLIETSNKAKQDQFLNLIAQENQTWEKTIRAKMLTLDKILSWPPATLSEIFSRVQPLTLATALNGMPPDKVTTILSCLSMSDQRKLQLEISERNPTPAEKATCVMKIITEVRGFCTGGILKLEKFDPDFAIPEGIEEKLANESFNSFTEATVTTPAEEPNESGLDFSGVKRESDATGSGANKDEVEFLKRRVNQLVQENNTLKHDLHVMRGKLDQIRKIA